MGIDIDDIESLLVQDTHENAYAGFCGQKEKYGVVSFMFKGKKSLTSVAQKKGKKGPQMPLWTLEVSCKGILDLGLPHGGGLNSPSAICVRQAFCQCALHPKEEDFPQRSTITRI